MDSDLLEVLMFNLLKRFALLSGCLSPQTAWPGKRREQDLYIQKGVHPKMNTSPCAEHFVTAF
jgi:hypothetical protein